MNYEQIANTAFNCPNISVCRFEDIVLKHRLTRVQIKPALNAWLYVASLAPHRWAKVTLSDARLDVSHLNIETHLLCPKSFFAFVNPENVPELYTARILHIPLEPPRVNAYSVTSQWSAIAPIEAVEFLPMPVDVSEIPNTYPGGVPTLSYKNRQIVLDRLPFIAGLPRRVLTVTR